MAVGSSYAALFALSLFSSFFLLTQLSLNKLLSRQFGLVLPVQTTRQWWQPTTPIRRSVIVNHNFKINIHNHILMFNFAYGQYYRAAANTGAGVLYYWYSINPNSSYYSQNSLSVSISMHICIHFLLWTGRISDRGPNLEVLT